MARRTPSSIGLRTMASSRGRGPTRPPAAYAGVATAERGISGAEPHLPQRSRSAGSERAACHRVAGNRTRDATMLAHRSFIVLADERLALPTLAHDGTAVVRGAGGGTDRPTGHRRPRSSSRASRSAGGLPPTEGTGAARAPHDGGRDSR